MKLRCNIINNTTGGNSDNTVLLHRQRTGIVYSSYRLIRCIPCNIVIHRIITYGVTATVSGNFWTVHSNLHLLQHPVKHSRLERSMVGRPVGYIECVERGMFGASRWKIHQILLLIITLSQFNLTLTDIQRADCRDKHQFILKISCKIIPGKELDPSFGLVTAYGSTIGIGQFIIGTGHLVIVNH